MGLYVHDPNPNAFVRVMRKLYHNGLQFKKGYSFVLWFIFAGALFGFACARLQYLDINNTFRRNAAPGEWFYYQRPFYKLGMLLHLASVLPAALLAPFQFIPAIRYRALLFHRLNGYSVLLLTLSGTAGALMIARHAFGGTLATQSLVGTFAIMVVASSTLGYINIKRLQIDQHRAWMLRCWVYMGIIVTMRLLMILAATLISARPGYFFAIPCAQIADMGGDTSAYPACVADPRARAVVDANFTSPQGVEQVAASFYMSFGTAGWVSLALHTLGAELYLRLTPAEGERLRRVSYERQLERGFARPGSAGLTVDRLGDAEPWAPPVELVEKGDAERVGSGSGREGDEVLRKPGAAMGWR